MPPAPFLHLQPAVRTALAESRPVVALESAVISHGLLWPDNLELARDMEAAVRAGGAEPATIALLEGRIHVGLDDRDLEHMARASGSWPAIWKISRRDLPVAMAQKRDGATTVAGTILIAHQAGIRVMATGGIGGVHRGDPTDVSADLPEIARTPIVVVCSGAKAILDLPATLEWLETWGVPVVGYQTGELPAFYARESGLPLEARADTPAEVAAIEQAMRDAGYQGGLLLCVPCPAEAARPVEEMERAIGQAVQEAGSWGLHGKAPDPLPAHTRRRAHRREEPGRQSGAAPQQRPNGGAGGGGDREAIGVIREALRSWNWWGEAAPSQSRKTVNGRRFFEVAVVLSGKIRDPRPESSAESCGTPFQLLAGRPAFGPQHLGHALADQLRDGAPLFGGDLFEESVLFFAQLNVPGDHDDSFSGKPTAGS